MIVMRPHRDEINKRYINGRGANNYLVVRVNKQLKS